MLKLTFKQTSAELMVRAASTIIFKTLNQLDYPSVALYELAENPQYGFTASASIEEVGAKFVRITDLKNGGINWDTVPYCKCDEPEKYLIYPNDILFARTGATTGKTHLVKEAPYAVFASYLIRIRPKPLVEPEYLYSFFQSDAYWTQILDEKEGSAQPNVNGQKLINILVPIVDSEAQSAISKFLEVVRKRQDGNFEELPELPPPLEEQRRIMMRVEELVGKVEEVRSLRQQARKEVEALMGVEEVKIWTDESLKNAPILQDVTTYLSRGRQSKQGESNHYLIKTQHVQMGKYVKPQITLAPDIAAKVSSEAIVRHGDILIACSAAGCLGRVAYYIDSGIVASTDTHIAIARANRELILPEYLYAYLKGFQGQVQLRSREKGDWAREKVGFRLTELNVADMRRIPIPLPPLPEQHRIVTYLHELQTKLDTMKQLREQAMTELNALLPSILDKAFKGEL